MTETVAVVLDDARLDAHVEIGLLSHERKGSAEVTRFSYSQTWLDRADAFPIDPQLPLYPGDQFPSGRSSFGIVRDASPDRWGRVLMERREAVEARYGKRKPRRLGEWDFLLGVSDEGRVGGLRFHQTTGDERFLDPRVLGVPPSPTRDASDASLCARIRSGGGERCQTKVEMSGRLQAAEDDFDTPVIDPLTIGGCAAGAQRFRSYS
jgi:hypothetical protein